jgi:N-formylmaleamate deformylase
VSGLAEQVRRYRPLEELIPRHWLQETVVANGARHHYYRTGGGKPPALLLHGFLDGAPSWFAVARRLERELDLIMPDARGHGRSQRSGGHHDLDRLAEDAAAIVHALGVAPTGVIGHSMGGGTGMRMADRHPDLVRALVVEGWGDDGRGGPEATESPGYQAWFKGYLTWLEQLKTQTHEERMVSGLSQMVPGAPPLPEEEYVAWVDDCAHLDLDLVRLGAALWSSVAAERQYMSEALGRVSPKVLVLRSDFFPTPGERRLTEEPSGRVNVRIVRFEHTGHLIHRDALSDFIDVVHQFLGTLSPT